MFVPVVGVQHVLSCTAPLVFNNCTQFSFFIQVGPGDSQQQHIEPAPSGVWCTPPLTVVLRKLVMLEEHMQADERSVVPSDAPRISCVSRSLVPSVACVVCCSDMVLTVC